MLRLSDLPRSLEEILKLPNVHFVDRSLLPNESGIYFVVFEAKNQRLAYIGKAGNLRMRWTGHHREAELWLLTSLNIPVDIAWLEVAKEDLKEAEDFLIQNFSPPLNNIETLKVRQEHIKRNNPRLLKTVSEVLQDYRDRKFQAIKLLQSDDFWEACNEEEDGDLICPWIYPNEALLANVNELWMYSDTHTIDAIRVPFPPTFLANNSGTIQPKEGYIATSTEKRLWLIKVAQQIDAWLVAVAHYHAAQISQSAVRQTLQALASEKNIEQTFMQ